MCLATVKGPKTPSALWIDNTVLTLRWTFLSSSDIWVRDRVRDAPVPIELPVYLPENMQNSIKWP